jgi:predicted enzyme related to lactoylglutathione lyase
VFDFGYEPWGEDMGMLRTGGGIDGDLHQRGAAPHPTIVITVDRIEDTVELVLENGGEQVGEIHPLVGGVPCAPRHHGAPCATGRWPAGR